MASERDDGRVSAVHERPVDEGRCSVGAGDGPGPAACAEPRAVAFQGVPGGRGR